MVLLFLVIVIRLTNKMHTDRLHANIKHLGEVPTTHAIKGNVIITI